MTAKGHVLLAVPVAITLNEHFGLNGYFGTFFIGLVVVGSLFPDIDEPESYIGRRLWFMSWLIKSLSLFFPAFRHRGITHIFLVPMILIAVGSIFGNIWVAAFGLGWLLHTIGDLLTVGGIHGYFYPISKEKVVLLPEWLRFKTNSFVEHVIIVFLLMLNSYLINEYFLSGAG